MLLLFYVLEGDMYYFQVDFDDSLQRKFEQGKMEGRSAESYDVSFTRSLSAGETKFGFDNGIVGLFVYRDFESSFLVTA